MTAVAVIALSALSVAAALAVIRLLRPGSLADRIVALDGLLIVVVSGIATHAFWTRSGVFLDVLVVAALLGFASTVTVARFIERRGA